MPTPLTLPKTSPIARSEDELFRSGPKNWKKGQITNPSWLKRENGSDFITIKGPKDLSDLKKYLSQDEPKLQVEYYNTFSTGLDKAEHPMIGLYDQDEEGNQRKVAIIIVVEKTLAMVCVELVETHCGEE